MLMLLRASVLILPGMLCSVSLQVAKGHAKFYLRIHQHGVRVDVPVADAIGVQVAQPGNHTIRRAEHIRARYRLAEGPRWAQDAVRTLPRLPLPIRQSDSQTGTREDGQSEGGCQCQCQCQCQRQRQRARGSTCPSDSRTVRQAFRQSGSQSGGASARRAGVSICPSDSRTGGQAVSRTVRQSEDRRREGASSR
eukprot:708504-Pyramimonas_sp.AAC.1